MSYTIRTQAGKGPQPRHVDGEAYRAKHAAIFKPKPQAGRMCPECDAGILRGDPLACGACGVVFPTDP